MRTGWTSAQWAAEPVPKIKALRWALFVERIWPKNAREIDAPFDNPNEPDADRISRAKAQIDLGKLREYVFPEDD